jgi:hypothetical protein
MARKHHRRSTALARPTASFSYTRPAPIVIRSTKVIKAPKKHHRHGRHGGKFGEKHRVGAILGGAVLGLLDKSGTTIPTLPYLGKAGTVGVAAWVIGKYMHNQWAEDMATGMLSIAAYELAKEGSISGVVGQDYIAGGL